MSIAEKLTTIAENEQKVYDAGKKSQYDEFWDSFQENGNRTAYNQAFHFRGWTPENFKPKYNLQPTNAYQMFYNLGFDENTYIAWDLKTHLESLGVTLDFSKATDMRYCFQNAKFTRLGVIDLSSAKNNVNTIFSNVYWLKSIEKLIVNKDNVFDNYGFSNCYATHVIFEGALGSNIIYKTVALDEASVKSLLSILVDYSGAGETRTLTLHADAKARLSEVDIAIATQKGWTIA